MSKDTQKSLFLVLLMIAACTGIYVGYITFHKFEILVKGVSGGAIIVLINLVLFRRKGVNLSKPIELRRDIIFIPIIFIVFVLSYWSGQNLVDMLIYYF